MLHSAGGSPWEIVGVLTNGGCEKGSVVIGSMPPLQKRFIDQNISVGMIVQ